MANTKAKSPIKNPKEALTSILQGVKDSVVDDALQKSAEDFWAQVTDNLGENHHKVHGKDNHQASEATPEENHGGETISLSGMLSPGEWLNLSGVNPDSHQMTESKPETKKNAAPGIDYHRDVATITETSMSREGYESKKQVQEIYAELDRIVETSNKIIQDEFGGITVEQAPKEVGKYHINFLNWMLIAIRTAREKVEDSGAWLAAMRGKKGKKNGAMLLNAQKTGDTKVSMSNERQLATQTG